MAMASPPSPGAGSSSDAAPRSVEPLKFVYDLPPISERQLAIVKLVARHAACDSGFAETRARDFDFTSAAHELHALYASFVEQYRLVLHGAAPNRTPVLQRAVQRALLEPEEPTKPAAPTGPQQSQQSQQSQEPREPREPQVPQLESAPAVSAAAVSALAAIDWQDFVVLETVEFFSADLKGTSPLSAPLTRDEVMLHREQASRKRRPREPLYKSPYTGESIPASQFDEHMRVHSLDPAWHRQKRVAAERQATTNLDTKSAAENLARLQEKRRRLLDE